MEQNSITTPQPRTSPSNLRRRYLCPGSGRMEAGVPDEDSTDANRGKLLHKYWANPEYDRAFLSNYERDLLVTTDSLMDEVLARLLFPATASLEHERRLSTLDDRMDGQPDRVYYWQELHAALVADLKSGFMGEESADENLQLRGYALLVGDNYKKLERIFVALLQPKRPRSEKITLAEYGLLDIVRSRKQIYGIIEASEKPDAPLVAGEEQCRFCRAKLICPAFQEAMQSPLTFFRRPELSKAAREAFIERKIKECSDDQLERIISACKLAGYVETAAADEARERIRAGSYTKFVLGKESEVRVVTDVWRAVGLLALAGVTSRTEALRNCEIALTVIEDQYRSANPGTTWKEARDKVDTVLKSVLSMETRKPRILPKKK
jgi:hypothetical protein